MFCSSLAGMRFVIHAESDIKHKETLKYEVVSSVRESMFSSTAFMRYIFRDPGKGWCYFEESQL